MSRQRRRASAAGGPSLTVVYWRDIPAQIVAKHGAETRKVELSSRFQEAIDSCAMRSGARETDAYLADWRRGNPTACGTELEEEVATAANRLEAQFDSTKLKTLIDNSGWN